MRTHGWSGSTPGSDDEAVERILAAAGELIDTSDEDVTILKVAQRLGVSRQTVYRYFDSTAALLVAAAEQVAINFRNDLADSLRGISDPAEAMVEAMAVTVELVGGHPRVGLLFRPAQHGRFAGSVTDNTATGLARSILDGLDVDWERHGWRDSELDELVEHCLRVIQSFLLESGHSSHTGVDLRRYLRRWVAPAIIPTATSPE
ncbi:TetR/AcrR family transcriptional regulator [Nocardia sp. NPDC005825]|uniref:TetR/AcrR family transcriptional regulator n=1 Tax=unclassified Nocardia TaxID=2637762 RepID=UPI0033FD8983